MLLQPLSIYTGSKGQEREVILYFSDFIHMHSIKTIPNTIYYYSSINTHALNTYYLMWSHVLPKVYINDNQILNISIMAIGSSVR